MLAFGSDLYTDKLPPDKRENVGSIPTTPTILK